MSSEKENIIAGIKLHTDKPTDVSLHRLYGWVIWQFPRSEKRGFQAAIRPPLAEHDWIPALIQAEKDRARVYGNALKRYPTPEEAAEFFQENDI
jgi:hypothetical protein